MKRNTLIAVLMAVLGGASLTQNNSMQTGSPYAPDEWLLLNRGSVWWYTTKPSPTPVPLTQRAPTEREQAAIDSARGRMASPTARAFGSPTTAC